MGVKYLLNMSNQRSKKKAPVGIYVEKSLKSALLAEARHRGLTLTELVVDLASRNPAVKRHLKKAAVEAK